MNVDALDALRKRTINSPLEDSAIEEQDRFRTGWLRCRREPRSFHLLPPYRAPTECSSLAILGNLVTHLDEVSALRCD